MTSKSVAQGKELQWLLASLRPYRRYVAGSLFSAIAHSGFNLLIPAVIGYMVTGLGAPDEASRLGTVNLSMLMLAGLFAAQALMGFLANLWSERVGEGIAFDLRMNLFQHLLHLPLRFFFNRQVGELSARLVDDVKAVRNLVVETPTALLRHCVVSIAVLGLLFYLSVQLTAVALTSIFLLALGGSVVLNHIQRASVEVQDRQAQALAFASEALHGVATIKAYVREDATQQRFARMMEQTLRLTLRRNAVQAAILPAANIIAFGVVGFVIWLAASDVARGITSGATLVSYLIYAGMMAVSVSQVAQHLGKFRQAMGSVQRVLELLAEPPEDLGGAVEPASVQGTVRFENVTFAYPGAEQPAIKGLTTTVKAGTVVAVVGPSGAGKSTLAHLLLRFFDPQVGGVYLDGRDLRTLAPRRLRSQIGVVPQDISLFTGTIRENILWGRPEAGEAEMQAAAAAANVVEFVDQLPDGYDTWVGERGVTLSRGQCQRIAIARMLLKAPQILIFDEATASLDSANESLVQEAMRHLLEGRTSFIISHRATTIRDVDRILVLVDGQLVEDGVHEELLAHGGLYARLFQPQLVSEEAG